MSNQNLSRHSHGGWVFAMEKWLCWTALSISGLLLLFFILDIFLGIPFGGGSKFIDIMGILASGLVGYLGWDAFRDLR